MIDGSRKRRIAAGSGTKVQDVNALLKQFEQTRKMIKQISDASRRRGPLGRCLSCHEQHFGGAFNNMAVRIRLMRTGAKKQPSYRLVVADSRSPRDGRVH